MLNLFRNKGFAKYGVYTIISLISAVFVFYGVFNPRSTRGLHEGAVAGTINGEPVSISEFNREYNQQLEFFKNLSGGKIPEEQIKALGLRMQVFSRIARKKLMVQEAVRQGLEPSEAEIRDRIAEMPYFKKDGKFDYDTYKQILAANNFTAGGFERTVREDLAAARWQDYFRDQVHFSDDELKQAYQAGETKRNIKYVLVTPDAARKTLQISDADVQKVLADPAKKSLIETRYNARKETEYKGKTLDQVKGQIAHDLVAGDKIEETQKAADKIADEVLPLLKADKASDAKTNAALKAHGLEVRSTGLQPRGDSYVPGLGEAKDLIHDAFAKKSPIAPAQGGQAKKYKLAGGVAVALVSETQEPDLSKFEDQRPQLIRTVVSRKERSLMDQWMGAVQKSAKIDTNPSVVGADAGDTSEGG